MVVLYFIVVLCVLAYYWVKKRYNYWIDRGFHSAPASFPFGSLQGVGTKKTNAERLDEIYKSFKGRASVVGYFTFLAPTILPIDPELYKNIFVRDFASFHDRGFYYNKEDDPTSANLLSLEGSEWKDRRVKLSPIFTSGKMKMMFEIVDSIGDRLIEVINKETKVADSLELKSLAGKYTADVIGNVAFGLDCKCLEDPESEFMKAGNKLFEISVTTLFKFILSSTFPNLSRKLHIAINNKEASSFFLNTFLQTLEHREKNKIKRNDFVSMLLDLKDHFTPKELAAESFLIYGGGFETSSTLIAFTLYEMALNPEIQEKLREEVVAGLNENGGKLTYEMLHGFKYLDMVINETLRKYPPIPGSIRKCTKEYKIPGTDLVIPKGTSVELAYYSLQHDPEYYPEPEKFDPERFSAENIKSNHSFTFLPFGDGPRNCIGMRFGLMKSKLAVIKILQFYEILKCDKTLIPMKFIPSRPFLAPDGGLWLKLRKIE